MKRLDIKMNLEKSQQLLLSNSVLKVLGDGINGGVNLEEMEVEGENSKCRTNYSGADYCSKFERKSLKFKKYEKSA